MNGDADDEQTHHRLSDGHRASSEFIHQLLEKFMTNAEHSDDVDERLRRKTRKTKAIVKGDPREFMG
jgi:hypothetical protein